MRISVRIGVWSMIDDEGSGVAVAHSRGCFHGRPRDSTQTDRHRRWCLVSGSGMAQRPVNLGRDQRGETGQLCGGWLNAVAEGPDSRQATTIDNERIRKKK